MLKRRKYIELYNCVGSMILGFSVEVFLGVSIGVEKGWEECMPVGMVPEGETVDSMGITMMREVG